MTTANKKDVHIALLMMVKNEKKRLHVTLNSVLGYVKSLIIYDTGSTDNTIEILETFAKTNNLPLRLKQGEFEDFSTSRNIALDFADTFEDVDYVLMMDTNDELRNGDKLIEFAKAELNNHQNSAFLMCQEWYSGNHDKYYNTRFIKPRNNWRYKGSVHEYLRNLNFEFEQGPPIVRIDDSIVLFQDSQEIKFYY